MPDTHGMEDVDMSYVNREGEKWYENILTDLSRFPFSFVYTGKRYQGFAADGIELLTRQDHEQAGKRSTVLTFRLEELLQIRVESAFYPDYGAAEWTIWFENTGTHDSGILTETECCLSFPGDAPVLKGILGDHDGRYRPYCHDLTEGAVQYGSDSGHPTHGAFPYFNLEYGNGGVMLAIGWAGTWKADFTFDGRETMYRARSVVDLATCLRPGERIRTALFVRAPYQVREEDYATNYWRSWFVRHNMPRADASGKELEPFSTCCLASDTGIPNSDGSISERYSTWRPSLEKMAEENIQVDFRWVDAGWYVAPDGSSPVEDWWGTIGTWEPDPVKWPGKTFRESVDYARELGMKTLLWFEPERVTFPWLLEKTYGYRQEWAIPEDGKNFGVNNIGDEECLAWTTERICKMLRENGIDMYREDHNLSPAPLWRKKDTQEGEGRRGITECKIVAAHYRMWDDIIACTKSLGGCGYVDCCAGGGGRNDLESLRRGVPLLRSDADRTTTALRLSMTTSFNRWIPFCGANTKEKKGELDATGDSDPYIWRASYLPALNVDSQFVCDPDQDFGLLRAGLEEWKKVSPWLLKDMYVHTPWHAEDDRTGFTAYSFYDEEKENGVLFLFRMEECMQDNLTVRLPFAKEDASYRLTDQDSGEEEVCGGRSAGEKGVSFRLPRKRMARLVWINREDRNDV